VEITQGKSIINHYNGDGIITVTANVEEDVITSTNVAQMSNREFIEVPQKYPGVYIIHGGEAKKRGEAMVGFAAAFILIYFILNLMFKSLSPLLLILLIALLGLIGSLLSFINMDMKRLFNRRFRKGNLNVKSGGA